MRSILILSLFLLILGSCYERAEGCLDFRAENYDFGADDPCEDCCSFPTLRIAVNHEWGDTTLSRDSIYQNAANQFIQIIESKFYLSNIVLTSGGTTTTVSEEIVVESLDGIESKISAANALVQTTRFNYDLGTFEEADMYDGLEFEIGINGVFISDDISTDDEMFDDSTYQYTNFRMEVVVDQINRDTIVMEIKGVEEVTPLSLVGQIDIPLGEDYSLPIVADYEKLLEDIDFDNILSQNEIDKVKSNFSDFLSIE